MVIAVTIVLVMLVFAQETVSPQVVNYSFEEPSDLYWLVKSHSDVVYPCGADPSREYFFKITKDLFNFSSTEEKEAQINKFFRDCSEDRFFYYRGTEMKFDDGMQRCYDNLSASISDVDPNLANRREVIKECYIRKNFREKNNIDSFEGANSEVRELIKKRDEEFRSFAGYNIEYPGVRVAEIRNQTSERNVSTPNIINRNHVCRPDLGDRCKNKNLSRFDNTTAIEEPSKVPSISTIQLMKSKLKSFFRWLG